MKKICVEGWRRINHSYAMVNQWQLLELVKSPNHLRHRDVPYFNPKWNPRASSSGFSRDHDEILAAITGPLMRESFDITYRISYPYNIGPAESGRLFVFGTAETQLAGRMFANGGLEDAAGNDAVTFITPSQWSRAGFLRAGFESDRVLVVSHGVDPGTFCPLHEEGRMQVRSALRLKATDFALLSVGAMTPNKGIDLLIIAYAALKRQYGNLKLLLKDQSNLYGIGARHYVHEIRKTRYGHLLTDGAIADIAFVSQNLSLAQLRGLYAASDCYVSPYRAEGFNLPPLEAAACGVPIVVTKGGSTDDYFHPVMGSQIDAAPDDGSRRLDPDLDSLVSRLAAIIEGKVACGGGEASRHVHEHFSWAVITRRLLSALGA